MPIYKTKIQGRNKPLLLKAESAAKGKDQIVTLEALTAEEMAEALASGEKVWTPGEPFPADEEIEDGAE